MSVNVLATVCTIILLSLKFTDFGEQQQHTCKTSVHQYLDICLEESNFTEPNIYNFENAASANINLQWYRMALSFSNIH